MLDNKSINIICQIHEKSKYISNRCIVYGYNKYPKVRSRFGQMSISRYFMIEMGKLDREDKTQVVCHTCDNPNCINIKHLFIGTQSDNLQDSISKNRNTQKRKTHCPNNHEYSHANTYIGNIGRRYCRTCHKLSERKRKARLKAKRHEKENITL
jgi:hypothetical protein